jgi:hypothetical protein
MSWKSPGLDSSSNAALRPTGSGTAGAFWMVTSGAGSGVGVRSGSSLARVSVETGRISGSVSCSSVPQRQYRDSSIASQALHWPETASAYTPRVGTLIRSGGAGGAA